MRNPSTYGRTKEVVRIRYRHSKECPWCGSPEIQCLGNKVYCKSCKTHFERRYLIERIVEHVTTSYRPKKLVIE